jgi:hypothetical protein
MTTPTYDLISSTVLTTNSSSFDFQSLPSSSSYKDLVLVGSFKMDASNRNLALKINNSTSSIYNRFYVSGTGSQVDSLANSGINGFSFNSSSTGTINIVANFLDYSETGEYKTMIARFNDGSKEVGFWSLRFDDTSRISRLEFFSNNGSFLAGSSFQIYGIVG